MIIICYALFGIVVLFYLINLTLIKLQQYLLKSAQKLMEELFTSSTIAYTKKLKIRRKLP